MYRHPGKVCAYWDQLIYHHDLCEVRGTEQSLVLIRKPCWSRKELGIITAGRRVEVARHSREKGQGHAPRQGEGSKSHATAGGRVKVTRHSRGKGRWFKTGIPSPWATDWYWFVACWKLGHTAGGEWRVSKQSFVCIYSCSPSLALSPEPHLVPDHW